MSTTTPLDSHSSDLERATFKKLPSGHIAKRISADNDGPLPTEPTTSGTTTHFTGNVNTGGETIPAVAGNDITKIIIALPSSTPQNRRLEVSFDGGAKFHFIEQDMPFIWEPKSTTQIELRSSSASVSYSIIMNRKA